MNQFDALRTLQDTRRRKRGPGILGAILAVIVAVIYIALILVSIACSLAVAAIVITAACDLLGIGFESVYPWF